MNNPQPELLKQPERLQASSGPVFEFGPGWGAKIKKWSKKYILAGDCSLCRNTRYILLAGIIILIIGWPQFKKISRRQPQDSSVNQTKIAETARIGDGKIKLARRILSNYLAQFPEKNLTNGQKIFIETVLGQNIANAAFYAGANIEMAIDDVKSAIDKSKLLTASQLQRWEASAKNVKFK